MVHHRLGLIIGAINFIATIHNMRAPAWLGPDAAVRVDDPDLRVPDRFARTSLATVTMLLLDRDFGIAFFNLFEAARRCCGSTCSASGTSRSTSSCRRRSACFEVLPAFARKLIFGYKVIAAATAGIVFLGTPCGVPHVRDADVDRRARVDVSSFIIAVRPARRSSTGSRRVARPGPAVDGAAVLCGGIFTFTMGGIMTFPGCLPDRWEPDERAPTLVVVHFHYMVFGASALRCSPRSTLKLPRR